MIAGLWKRVWDHSLTSEHSLGSDVGQEKAADGEESLRKVQGAAWRHNEFSVSGRVEVD